MNYMNKIKEALVYACEPKPARLEETDERMRRGFKHSDGEMF